MYVPLHFIPLTSYQNPPVPFAPPKIEGPACLKYFNLCGAGEMGQWLKLWTALAGDPSLVPSTQIRQLTTACNSSYRSKSDAWLPLLTCTYPHLDTYTQLKSF